jgi:hypothetical protein
MIVDCGFPQSAIYNLKLQIIGFFWLSGLFRLPANGGLGLRLVIQILFEQGGGFRMVYVNGLVVISGMNGWLEADWSANTEQLK